jgi:hypothetical protein
MGWRCQMRWPEPTSKRSGLGSARRPAIRHTRLQLICVLLATIISACGGGGSSGGSGAGSGSNTGGGSGGGGSTPAPPTTANGATVVNVTAGQQTAGININVGSLTPSLSLVAVGIGNSAGSVGVSLKQGATVRLLLAGQGIVQGTSYSISQGSPGDVTVNQPAAADFCTTTGGTPCVSLNVTVNAGAAPGPRNIMATKSNGELAVFTGGLIVVSGP